MSLSVATINVNGLHAAVRRGMDAWVAQAKPDVMALQEVRAPDDVVAPLLFGDGWSHVGASSALKGHRRRGRRGSYRGDRHQRRDR